MKRYQLITLVMSIISVILLSVIITNDAIERMSIHEPTEVHGDSILVSYDDYWEYYEILLTADLIAGYHDYTFEALGNDYHLFDGCYNPILENLCECAEEFLPQWEADKFCN